MNDELIRKKTKTLQILSISLLTGMVVITALVGFIKFNGGADIAANLPFPLWIVPCAMIPLVLFLPLLLGPVIERNAVKAMLKLEKSVLVPSLTPDSQNQSRIESFFGIISSLHMLTYALPESVGIIGGFFYMIEGNELSLLAPAMALVVMILLFPTRARVERSLARLERLAAE